MEILKRSLMAMEFPEESQLLNDPRQDHYWFAHRVVRDICKQNPSRFFMRMNEETRFILLNLMIDSTEDITGEPAKNFLSEDLDVITRQIADCPSVIITMPEPLAVTEAYMVAVVFTKEEGDETQDESFRYFTLELSQSFDGDLRTVFCEWTDDAHLNFGKGPLANVDAFSQAIENKIKGDSNRARQSKDASKHFIVAGQGWTEICLGADREAVEIFLGKCENLDHFDDVYFMDYPDKGIEISFKNIDNMLNAVFFYNRQCSRKDFVSFKGKTDKGIDWSASPKDVIKAYGEPKADFNGKGWQRMQFEGIDFLWEDHVLVRIGISDDLASKTTV